MGIGRERNPPAAYERLGLAAERRGSASDDVLNASIRQDDTVNAR